jgi:hydroxymethylpyrimidine/phosphomethylpyrimidine kinase
MNDKIFRVLTVAGSDSGGGAGIQADLRTAALLGCHGASAITAITAQNTLGVQAIYPLEPEAVASQVKSVLSDIGADAVKTGMLFSSEIIEAVADVLDEYGVERLVVDPVMIAKGGASLLKEDARKALIERILPLAAVVTPNLPEAEALTGVKIDSDASRREACRLILKMGPKAVLLKGGHGEGETVEDLFVAADGTEEAFVNRRLDTKNTHGTGCTLSAALAAYLSKGESPLNATARAVAFVHRAIAGGYELGQGHGPTNPYFAAGADDRALLSRLGEAWELLEDNHPHGLIPEVQSNLAEALPDARSFEDIAAYAGRITRAGRRIRRSDGPAFGASRHMAKILLASARASSPFRAVMNIRYGLDVLDVCRELGYTVGGFSRADEPPEVQASEGSTMEWGTAKVLTEMGHFPDVIFDEGGDGKEPMIRLFGTDAVDVAKKVCAVWDKLK